MPHGRRDPIIGYTIVESSLGTVLVGATKGGVAAVLFGAAEDLLAGLSREHPGAELVRDDGALADIAAAVIAAINGVPSPTLPLDLGGTEFQRAVWKALGEIPVGTTATYSEVAAAIGRPKSVRAVANACGDNRIAVLVPCHRVVRTDGGLGGYKWGLDRKRALLEAEGAPLPR